jgi:Flp pilus assembly protein CpaB
MNKLALILAVIAGVAGLFVSYLYLQAETPEEVVQEAKTAILVAARDLPANHVLGETDLKPQEIPATTFAELARTAIKPAEMGAIMNRRLGGPVSAGSYLLYSDLVSIVDLEFDADKRALSFPIGGDQAVGGMIIPGDRVDIVVTRPVPPEPPDLSGVDPTNQQEMMSTALANMIRNEEQVTFEAEILLEDVEIMAVGQRLKWNREQLFRTDPQGFSPGGAPPSVTVALSVEDALTLIEARASAGELTLLLRSSAEPGGFIEN